MIASYARNVQGYPWNHNRIHMIYYCTLELNLQIKPRRRIKRGTPEALSVPNTVRSMGEEDRKTV